MTKADYFTAPLGEARHQRPFDILVNGRTVATYWAYDAEDALVLAAGDGLEFEDVPTAVPRVSEDPQESRQQRAAELVEKLLSR